ncbi:GTPase [Aureococcus anophagefferens]|nr:GTPase [Aureococcus anophagefferens]
MMEYDEFGNLIGGDSDDESEGEAAPAAYGDASAGDGQVVAMEEDEVGERAVVLHEDKQYYPDAADVYPGADRRARRGRSRRGADPQARGCGGFSTLDHSAPGEKSYTVDFMRGLMERPELIRNVALLGNLHCGKTTLTDVFVQHAHRVEWDPSKEFKFSDTRKDEQERQLSIKCAPVSMVLPDSRGKHYMVHLVDCPGHVGFNDEVTAALRAVDGAVIVVDAVEGVMASTERLIKHAIEARVGLTLVINKVDRLILELKLPPTDAYFKLVHTVDDVNACVAECWGAARDRLRLGDEQPPRLSPTKGDVCFASAQHCWCFTLESFARVYGEDAARKGSGGVDAKALGKRLWGDVYFDSSTRKFGRAPPPPTGAKQKRCQRSFVEFVLEPLYKIYAHVLGEEPGSLNAALGAVGIKLAVDELSLDPKPLLKCALRRFFKGRATAAFVDVISRHSPSPKAHSATKVAYHYCGALDGDRAAAMAGCADDGPSAGRVAPGARVNVLGENYSPDDPEDARPCVVAGVSVCHGRHATDVPSAGPGNLVLLEGVDASIAKTATIVDAAGGSDADPVHIFRPLKFDNLAVVKLATKVEESGEHVVLGTGELYLDCVMHDLREMYGAVEVKVADPVVAFCETVIETSSLKCFSETPNKRNKLTMIAEPLDAGVADAASGDADHRWSKKQVGQYFQKTYDWDLFAARSIWAFGPDALGSSSFGGGCSNGFQWGCREGPLCDEPIRNVKFKILDASISDVALHRGGGQVIPTARRVCYSAFLMACPRLMEPIFAVDVQCPADCVAAVYPVLARRRGHIVQDAPKPGAPFYTVKAYIPAVDSFGFETDLRAFTQGQAMCSQVFDHWAVCPGDPLDRSIILHPLEPSPPPHLAREFMVKTRRRKGLSEDGRELFVAGADGEERIGTEGELFRALARLAGDERVSFRTGRSGGYRSPAASRKRSRCEPSPEDGAAGKSFLNVSSSGLVIASPRVFDDLAAGRKAADGAGDVCEPCRCGARSSRTAGADALPPRATPRTSS